MDKPQQTSLFDTGDLDQVRGFKTKDEREFDKEQRRKSKDKSRKKQPLTKRPDRGPCCYRCRFWREPRHGDQYGECSQLVVLSAPIPRLQLTAGSIMTIDQAEVAYVQGSEPLRTGEAFQCSAYAAFGERAA